MSELIPDVLGIVGLVLLTTGVGLVFGYQWALIVSGLLLMVTGVAIAWGRKR